MKKKTIVLKYGGNAMTDEKIKRDLIRIISDLNEKDHDMIVVHGGGPYIKKALEEARIESEFIAGQRKTSAEALEYVEMTLKGKVNGNLVSLLNGHGQRAVGLSGKDGKLVTAKKRYHQSHEKGTQKQIDLGQVGNVEKVDTTLLHLLLKQNYLPVITCLGSDHEGNDYNINGDVFAGHIAGAMQADEFIILTDVDGLMHDIHDPSSLISSISSSGIKKLIEKGTIKGGMIPKIEACLTALQTGAKSARIINGKKPGQLHDLMNEMQTGTQIIA